MQISGVADSLKRMKSLTLAIHGALEEQTNQLEQLNADVADSHDRVQAIESRTQEVGAKARGCGRCVVM